MRVLVVSEGKHELGERQECRRKEPGALENLLRNLAGDEGNLTFEQDRVSNNAIHAVHGKGRRHFKRAVRWLKEAEKRGCDALVLLIDDDWKKNERRAEQITDAQQDCSLSQLPRAMGVAIRSFDAWMLADERALTDVLGYAVTKQPDPEAIGDPKGVCADLLAGSQNQIAQSEMYTRIMDQVDVAVLDRRCPSGFRPFAQRVRRLFEHE